MKKYQWILTTLIIASTSLPIQSIASTTNTSSNATSVESSKTILARVNNQPVYKSQLKDQIQAELNRYQQLTSKKQLSTELKNKIQNNILEKHIDAELIHQASQKHHVKNIEEKITQFIDNAKKNNQPIQNKTAIKRQIYINEYLKAHDLINPQPPEAEIKAFYEKTKQQFTSQEKRAHALHIFITEKNKDKIDKVITLLEKGTPFEQVAKEYSEDENTNNNGGDLGLIVQGYMPKEFTDIAFNIQIGKVSEVIKTEQGYHILKVLEIKPAGTTVPYEKVKDFLIRGFAPKTKERKVEAHLKQLRADAKIEIITSKKP